VPAALRHLPGDDRAGGARGAGGSGERAQGEGRLNTQRIEAVRDELAQCFADYQTLAMAYKERDELRALLRAIVDETYSGCPNMDRNGRYVKSGGGYRRLPDDLAALINEAAELTGDR